MCPFLFWMEHCGIWNMCILRFVRLVYSDPCNPHMRLRKRAIILFFQPCDIPYGWITNCRREIVSKLYHTDEVVIHTPDNVRPTVGISYRRPTISPVLYECNCYRIRTTYYLIRMTWLNMLSHTDDQLSRPYFMSAIAIAYRQLIISSVWHD